MAVGLLFPKPTKKDRPGERRRRAIANDWDRIRDERKRELQDQDGTWVCFYCDGIIYSWEECVMAHLEPKGREPAKKLCKKNLVPSHADCNMTNSKHYRVCGKMGA